MRILLWSGGYPPDLGGVEVVVEGLARSLAARGDVVEVVAQSPATDEVGQVSNRPEARLHRLPFHQVLSSRDPESVLAMSSRLRSLMEAFSPDIVHAHAVHPSHFFLLRALKSVPVPLIFTVHGWSRLEEGDESLRRRMLRAAARVTGCSRHVTDRATADVPEIAEAAETIYNGFSNPSLKPEPIPLDPPRLLGVGRLTRSKGFDRALGAMPAILEQHPDTRLAIAGEGPERGALERQRDVSGLGNAVEFLGRIEAAEVLRQLNAATMLLMPSRGGSEGLPLAALEAAYLERPIVATPDGGVPEIVLDGRTGRLVEHVDQQGLAPAVLDLLANPGRAQEMGRAGRRLVLSQFDWQQQMDRYSRLYENVIGSHPE